MIARLQAFCPMITMNKAGKDIKVTYNNEVLRQS
jgi:hypothetical protein